MTTAAETIPPLVRAGRFLRDYPVIPLIALLFGLIGLLEVMRPGIISPFWLSNTIKFAIPLAMLAACQTMTMLTGGIDLSAGVVATCAGFVVATVTPLYGAPAGVAIALGVAVLVGLVNGFGVGFARVHPLIMTLGTGLIATGCLQVYQRYVIATGSEIPQFLVWLGTGRTWILPNGLFVFIPFALIILLAAALHRLRAASLRAGVERERIAPVGCAQLAGLYRALRAFGSDRRDHRPALCRHDPRAVAVAGEPAHAAIGGGGGDRRHLDLRRSWQLFRAPSSAR